MTEGKSTYSPAPWEFSDGSIWAISPWNARVRIATIHRHSPMNGIDSDANGRLMKAAPKLLANLQAAERFMSGFEGDEQQEGIDEQLAELRAAIAEAKEG